MGAFGLTFFFFPDVVARTAEEAGLAGGSGGGARLVADSGRARGGAGAGARAGRHRGDDAHTRPAARPAR